MKIFNRAAMTVLFIALVACRQDADTPVAERTDERPNFLVIMTDDMGFTEPFRDGKASVYEGGLPVAATGSC